MEGQWYLPFDLFNDRVHLLDHDHLSSMAFLWNEGGKVAMVLVILILRNGRLWSWPPFIPPLIGRREGSHGIYLSPLEWISVVINILRSFPEGRRENNNGFSNLSWLVEGCGHGHPTSLFQKGEGEEAMTFAHLIFCAYYPWPSSPRRKEGRQP